MAVLTMANDHNKDGEKPLFHDFLGISCGFDSPAVPVEEVLKQSSGETPRPSPSASAGGGGGGETPRPSPSASAGGGGGETPRPSPSASAGGEASASVSVAAAASGGAHAPVSATSDMGSERRMANHFEGVPVHGLRSDFSGAEISNRIAGRKRSNSDSHFMGLSRDRMPQIGSESLENLHLMKMLRSGAGGERLRKSNDEELSFGMQPPKLASASHLPLQSSPGHRPDSISSKWESVMMNPGSSMQYPPRLAHFAKYVDKVSSNKYKDSNAGVSVISQPAADEGSRTGIKGSGILSGVNASSGASERNSSAVLLSCSRPNSGPQSVNPESSTPPSRHGSATASRQMTIFYAGQAHVFDEVHPNKADIIMALAGSNGGSWSTTFSAKPTIRSLPDEASPPNAEKGMGPSNLTLAKELRGKLSTPGSSSHGLSQVEQISTTINDPLNSSFGEHHGSIILQRTRPIAQAADPSIEDKRELR